MTTVAKPKQGERHNRAMQIVESRAIGGGRHEITIAAHAEARDMFEVDLNSLRMDSYLRNPVVMWSHDRHGATPSGGLPIARTTAISRTDSGGIRAEFEFLPDDEFADRVRNAWDHGFIRAASISWGGGEWTHLDNGKIRESNAELYEWSLVSIPADADALRAAERSMKLPEGTLAMPKARQIEDEIATLQEQVAALTEQVAGVAAAETALEAEVTALKGESAPAGETDDDDELAGLAAEIEALTASIKGS